MLAQGDLQVDMDTVQNYFILAVVAVVINRSYDLMHLLKIDVDVEEMLDNLLARFVGKDYHDENRRLTRWGLLVLVCLNMVVFWVLKDVLLNEVLC